MPQILLKFWKKPGKVSEQSEVIITILSFRRSSAELTMPHLSQNIELLTHSLIRQAAKIRTHNKAIRYQSV